MKPRRLVAQQDASEIFDLAVHDRALAVLTLHEDDDWCSFKSRFLERDPNGRFFVLDYHAPDGQPLPALVAGQYVGVSFRLKSRKILFATSVEARGHYVVENDGAIPAIRYRWPESLTELQRRSYYRTPVPDGARLFVHLWSGGVKARARAQGQTLQTLTGELMDVSCGGAMVRLNQLTPPRWVEDETLGVEMKLPDGRPPIVVDAQYRGARNDATGGIGVAIQFIGLELNVDGRLVLQRLANCVQKFHRMSLATGARDWNAGHGL